MRRASLAQQISVSNLAMTVEDAALAEKTQGRALHMLNSRELWNMVDADGSGSISFEEFQGLHHLIVREEAEQAKKELQELEELEKDERMVNRLKKFAGFLVLCLIALLGATTALGARNERSRHAPPRLDPASTLRRAPPRRARPTRGQLPRVRRDRHAPYAWAYNDKCTRWKRHITTAGVFYNHTDTAWGERAPKHATTIVDRTAVSR